jgi:hypothetical protein
MKRPVFIALAAALLFSNGSSAAERKIEIRCALIGSNADLAIRTAKLPRQYHVHDATGTTKLGTILLRFQGLDPHTETIDAAEGSLVITTDSDPGSVRNPEQVIGTWSLPSDASSLILAIIPRGPDLIGSQLLGFDDSAKAFPFGSIKMVNLSPNPFRFEIDDKQSEIAPGATESVTPTAPKAPGGLTEVWGYSWRGRDWARVYGASWLIAPNRREIQIIYPGSRPYPQLVGITDRLAN